MALKNKVLQDFFVSNNPINIHSKKEISSSKGHVDNNTHSHYRIFDNPIEKTDKNIGQT